MKTRNHLKILVLRNHQTIIFLMQIHSRNIFIHNSSSLINSGTEKIDRFSNFLAVYISNNYVLFVKTHLYSQTIFTYSNISSWRSQSLNPYQNFQQYLGNVYFYNFELRMYECVCSFVSTLSDVIIRSVHCVNMLLPLSFFLNQFQ